MQVNTSCKRKSIVKPVAWLIGLCFIGIILYVYHLLSFVDKAWQEEIILHDGSTVWLERTVRYYRGFGVTGPANVKFSNFTITIEENPVAPTPLIWQSSEKPIIMDYDSQKQTWYVVTTRLWTQPIENWKGPDYPYKQYEVQNGQWIQTPLNPNLFGRKSNLLTALVGGLADKSRITIPEGVSPLELAQKSQDIPEELRCKIDDKNLRGVFDDWVRGCH